MAFRLIDLVYPARCPVCGDLREFGKDGICEKCNTTLPWVESPVCLRCGKMIESDEREYCDDCTRVPKNFERCYPAFNYEGKIKDSIYEFKYKNQREYAGSYADCIMNKYGEELRGLSFAGIVPVPVHRHKLKVRGYNQAALLADALGSALSVKVYPDYIVRSVDTNAQKELSDTERIKNLKNAFKIGENDVKLDTVLLVDDIYTSGATMEACTNVLYAYGTKKVYCTCIAVGRGYS